ncbi:MAG: AAA family ATPase [Afipia sp.]
MNVDTKILIELLEAALAADYTKVRRLGGELSRLASENGEAETAARMRSLTRKKGVALQTSGYTEPLPVDAGSRLPLIEEQDWPGTPVFLNDEASGVVSHFIEDAKNIELLTNKGLSPRLRLMLSGEPGTGKSLLAGHIAAQLRRPFYVARLDSLISSRLGDTAKNIRGIFDFAPARGAVLFLDEMDAVAKLRDDRHELGELKRVVNTVIQGLDSLDGESVIIGATNHPHLLDPAIWRRFPYKIELHLPEQDVRQEMWRHFLFGDSPDHEIDSAILAALSEGLSGADIESLALTARRQEVLSDSPIDPIKVAWAIHSSRKGQLRLPNDKPLSSDDKRALAQHIAELPHVKKIDAADFLGVSRQMFARYLKEEHDGGN